MPPVISVLLSAACCRIDICILQTQENTCSLSLDQYQHEFALMTFSMPSYISSISSLKTPLEPASSFFFSSSSIRRDAFIASILTFAAGRSSVSNSPAAAISAINSCMHGLQQGCRVYKQLIYLFRTRIVESSSSSINSGLRIFSGCVSPNLHR